MDAGAAAELVGQAVEAARDVTGPEGYEPVWALLRRVAADGGTALRLGAGLLGSQDPVARATGCDLLGVASELHEEVRGAAAEAVLAIAGAEDDVDAQWSIARALGATGDRRAMPVLAALAVHDDADVRLQVAVALPGVSLDGAEDAEGAGIRTLIRLTADPDPEVRNWATFGVGFQAEVDSAEVRAALWARVGDEDAEVRAEGVRGLARRHDRRAVPLVAGLLDDPEGAHIHTFEAAAVLGAPELLPQLRGYDAADAGVADALAACDPVVRERRDAFAAATLDAVDRVLRDADFAVFADFFEPGLVLEVAVGGARYRWSVEGLLARAGGDAAAAARLVADDVEKGRVR